MLRLDLGLFRSVVGFTVPCTTGASILDTYVLQEADILCEGTIMG